MTIPDLRLEQAEVTLEHCSVLLEKLIEALSTTYEGDSLEFQQICLHIDAVRMRRDLLKIFTEKALLKLFSTPFGKGVIVGSFVQKFIFPEGE